MRDRSEAQRDYVEVEENHDGRTMILLVAGAVLACGLFLSAGYTAFTLIFDGVSIPDGVASNVPVAFTESDGPSDELISQPQAVTPSDSVPVSASRPQVLQPTVVATVPQTPAEPATIPATQGVIPESTNTEIAVTAEPKPVAKAPAEDLPKTVAGANSTVPKTAPAVAADVVNEAVQQQRTKPTAPSTPTQVAAVNPASVVDTKLTKDETAPPLKQPARGMPLSYQWNSGDIQGYSVDMTTTANGQKQSVSGTVELTCDEQPLKVDSKAAAKKSKPETGTGTGFFVSTDGYLVTCAHVIQGADKVDVEVNGKSYSAAVVAVEADDDLAILKIDAEGLSPLSLADSSKVRLGEEVRAIGFPLSTVLGNGIKVTRGIVAGIVDREDGQRFQIDAAINPGNSGGPVVNDRGQVLGVASSKLIGMELTRVGFCVPAQRVLSLLKANKVEALQAQPDKALDGPSLVEAVAPSVGLITVTIDPHTVSGELVKIRTTGNFKTKRATNNRQRMMFSFPNMTFNSGSLNVDAFGNVESFSAPNQLPFLAGPMALLTVHQFDPAGRTSWTVRNRIKISVQRDNSPSGRMRIPIPRLPRFGGRIRDPFAPQTIKEFDAQEVHQYRIVSDSDDKVVLEKTFTLTTLENDETPYFRISGKGEVVFSRKLGLIESFEFDHHYEKNDGKETVRIPVEIIVVREDSAVVAKRKRLSAIAQANVEHDNVIKAANKAVVPAGEQVDALIKKIKEEHAKGGFVSSLGSLAKLSVLPERQSEVEALLVDLLEDKQYLTVRSSLDALTKWGTPNCVPAVIPQLKHSMFPVVQSAIKTLATIDDERAVAPLLETLRANRLARHDAKEALSKLGSYVEESVIALLFEKDLQVFHAACDILKEVGGKASVEPLEAVASGKDFSRKSYADRALQGVKSRIAAAETAAATGEGSTDPSASRVEAVLKAMASPSDKSGYARTSALMKLGAPSAYKPAEVEDALLIALDDPNFAVQHQGMMALQKRATERSIRRLLKLFADPDSKLQYMAALTLQKTGVGVDGEVQLANVLATADKKRQKSIVDLLTTVGSPASLAVLDELANSPTASSVQYGAARAAARIRLRAGMPVSS